MENSLGIFKLNGKRALITGSSQGIGFSLAQALAGARAQIILNGRDAQKLKTAANQLIGLGADIYQPDFDLTDYRMAKAAIDEFELKTGRTLGKT